MTEARRIAMIALLAAMLGAAVAACGPGPSASTAPVPEPARTAGTKAVDEPPVLPVPSGSAMAAIDRASSAGRFLYVLCRREENAEARAMREGIGRTLEPLAERAELVEIDVRSPAESQFVRRFRLSRAPMPLVLVLAPNGAVTSALPLRCTEKQLRGALVGPGTAETLKGIQSGKTILLCIQGGDAEQNAGAMEGVRAIAADPKHRDLVQVVTLSPENPDEAGTLRSLKVDPEAREAVTVVLTSSGVAETFRGPTTMAELAKAIDACSSCGPTG